MRAAAWRTVAHMIDVDAKLGHRGLLRLRVLSQTVGGKHEIISASIIQQADDTRRCRVRFFLHSAAEESMMVSGFFLRTRLSVACHLASSAEQPAVDPVRWIWCLP